jgi:hypothetical protein
LIDNTEMARDRDTIFSHQVDISAGIDISAVIII